MKNFWKKFESSELLYSGLKRLVKRLAISNLYMEKQGSVTEEAKESDSNPQLFNNQENGNFVSASQLRREIEKIIGNMTCPQHKVQSEGEEEESVIEVCLSEVKIKEHKLEKSKKRQRKKMRKVEFSSSTDDKMDSCSDSAKTDIGIPPIPICDSPKQTEIRKKSAVVLDHLSRRKVYVPGREKSEFFRCPHRRIDDVGREMLVPLHCNQITPHPQIVMEKEVDRYHYNHFALRSNKPTSPEKNETLPIDGDVPSNDRLTLFKRLKLACSKLRNDKSALKIESQVSIDPQVMESEAVCYCGSGFINENHQNFEDFSSGESFDQLYKAKIDSTTCPTSFIFRAVDRDVKHHGEVHFVVENSKIPSEPILNNLRQSHQQSAMIISPVQPSSQSSSQHKEGAVQNSLDGKDDQSQQQTITTRDENKKLQKQYKPVRTRPERIDIYMFDHQDSRYFHTTDNPPPVLTEVAVHKVERVATQFWAEIFSILHVIFAFATTFILQTLKFVLLAIGRPLTTGLIQIFSDYFLKPLLTIIFNGLVQPPIIFIYNILTSFRDLCRPLATGLGYFVKELAQIVSAFRICKIFNKTSNGPFVAQPLENKV